MTKCLSCGYVHHEIQLNCSKCGSFYTEIMDDDESQKIKPETLGIIQKIKQQLERVIPTGVSHD
jgi:hypothetical protein